MKKTRFFAAALSLAVGLSLCAGVAACDKETPDDPMKAQWDAAFAAENFKSVQMEIEVVCPENERDPNARTGTYIVKNDRQYEKIKFPGSEFIQERYYLHTGDTVYSFAPSRGLDGNIVAWPKSENLYNKTDTDNRIESFAYQYAERYDYFEYSAAAGAYVVKESNLENIGGKTVVKIENGKLVSLYEERTVGGADANRASFIQTTILFTFGVPYLMIPTDEVFDDMQFEEDYTNYDPSSFTCIGTWKTYKYTVNGTSYKAGETVPEDAFGEGSPEMEVKEEWYTFVFNADGTGSIVSDFRNIGETYTEGTIEWTEENGVVTITYLSMRLEDGTELLVGSGTTVFKRAGKFLTASLNGASVRLAHS